MSVTSTKNDAAKQAAPVAFHPDEMPADDRGGGNRTTLLVSDAIGSRQMLNGITFIAPGAAIQHHTHNCEESVLVIEGRAIAELDGVDHELDTLDATWLPADLPHRFRNASKEQPLRIFWTYPSVDATRTLVATGQTHRIAAEHPR